MFWYKLHLFGDVYLSTGPEAVAEGEEIRMVPGIYTRARQGASRCQLRTCIRPARSAFLTWQIPCGALMRAGLRSLQPAVQYIAGELPVDIGQARCTSKQDSHRPRNLFLF